MSQYYIARIRYQNPLPPPPFPPKLVNIPTPIDPYTTTEYTSTLAQSQPPNIDIDVEGGMPLDLSIIPGLFEGDESGLYADPMRADLHPRDRELLKTPETATTPSRSHSHIAVPFLRRTEYIAAEKHSTPTNTGNILRGTRRPSLQVAQKELDHVFEDPEAQQQMVEQMFKDVDVDWVGRRHPKKRGVECVDSWEVLPDRGRIGQLLLLMRFQDDHISNSPDDSAMDVALLEPKEVPDFGIDFVFSTFLPDNTTAVEIKDHLSSGTDESSLPYTYTHVRDYGGNLIQNPVHKNDYAVYFLNSRDGTQRRGAYYLPITGKSNLKRRRVNKGSAAGDQRIDGIELTLRAPTEEEIEAYEKSIKEFEEGPALTEDDVVQTPEEEEEEDDDDADVDDGLSDTDAPGEVDPTYG